MDNKRKAYRIVTTQHNKGDWGIYSANNAGKAKTHTVSDLLDAYPNANYSWIVSCRRAPEYDELAQKTTGCIAWQNGKEHWQFEKGHWNESN